MLYSILAFGLFIGKGGGGFDGYVPRVLFTDKEHFGNLSNEAKHLYGLLLDRMSLSRRNNWFDEQDRVYIVFTIDEIEDMLDVSHDKVNNFLKELDDVNGIGLISKKRQGLGLPFILYVKNFIINGGGDKGFNG